MNRRLWKGLLVLNYVGLILFVGLAIHACLLSLVGPGRVTELNRAGVFNEERLMEFDKENGTDLAANLRYNIGHWIADPAVAAAVWRGDLAIGLITCNIVLLHCAKRSLKKPAC